MSGYIKIDRKILEWEWYKNINTKILFFHMLLKANWKDGKFEGKTIPRGSFVSSIPKLAVENDLTINEVRTAIKHLKETGEITVKTFSKYSVFTVSNYVLYQCDSQSDNSQITDKPQADNGQTTGNAQAINSQLTTIEEEKEYKEGKNITVSNDTICQTDVRHVIEKWNELKTVGINPVTRLKNTSKRYSNLIARIREYGIDNILIAIEKIKESDYCQGKNKYGWVITFDWFVLPSNFPKVLDGNYDNRSIPDTGKRENKSGNRFKNFDERNCDYESMVWAGFRKQTENREKKK